MEALLLGVATFIMVLYCFLKGYGSGRKMTKDEEEKAHRIVFEMSLLDSMRNRRD